MVATMNNEKVTHFFLGANSRDGFYSLYDNFVNFKEGDFLWVLKGGPGCGKSSFMQKLGAAAEKKGLPVQYIICSGDPDSLDGVYFPSLRAGFVDGTAPHVIETTYPGAASQYLNLGEFYDTDALGHKLGEIAKISDDYKALYAKAYEYLAAAGLMSAKRFPGLWGEAEKGRILKKLKGLAAREFKQLDKKGKIFYRFLSAISCKGIIFLQESVDELCDRVYTVDNELGMGSFYLEKLSEIASDKGYDIIICPDPLDPKLTQAVLIPELSLGFITTDSESKFEKTPYRHLRLDAIADKKQVSSARSKLRRSKKLSAQLVNAAVELLSQAKDLHDELEKCYNPHVDFDALYQTAADHVRWLFDE